MDGASTIHRSPLEDARATRRAHRVMVLLGGVIVLSLADLAITLTHLQTVGMMEANPVAAFIIRSTQSVAVLVAYKVVTVGICVGLLHRLRREPLGEWACWGSLAVLVWLSLIWGAYSDEMPPPSSEVIVRQHETDAWLHLD